MEKVEIKKARNGSGVFATKDFYKDDIVFQVRGKLISCDVEDDLDETERSNSFRFDEDLYLSPTGEMGDFLNHSCEPNSAVVKKRGKLWIVAVKDFKKGKEVLIDYSTIIASDDKWRMRCDCGSLKCRHIIGQFQKLPKKLQKEYISSGMVPEYIVG